MHVYYFSGAKVVQHQDQELSHQKLNIKLIARSIYYNLRLAGQTIQTHV